MEGVLKRHKAAATEGTRILNMFSPKNKARRTDKLLTRIIEISNYFKRSCTHDL